jgi:hypothetical protein
VASAGCFGFRPCNIISAEALEAAARPHDDVTVSEYPMLKVLELAAAQHAAELRQVTGLAKIISERRPA